MAETVTIFLSEEKWSAGDRCFDLRYDGEMLPHGSVVVGFAANNGKGAAKVFHVLRNERQVENLREVLDLALSEVDLVGYRWVEDPPHRFAPPSILGATLSPTKD